MRSLILQTGMRAVFHTIVLLSVFFLFAGHNAPGGGFIGGLVAGAAIVLLYVSIGADGMRQAVRVRPEPVLGVGVLLAAGAGIAAVAAGGQFLESAALDLAVPLLGELHLSSVLIFDIGVYLVVVGLVLEILLSLGAEMEVPR